MPRTDDELVGALAAQDDAQAGQFDKLVDSLRDGPLAAQIEPAASLVARVAEDGPGDPQHLEPSTPAERAAITALIDARTGRGRKPIPIDVGIGDPATTEPGAAAVLTAGMLGLGDHARNKRTIDGLVAIATGATRVDLLLRSVLTGGSGLGQPGLDPLRDPNPADALDDLRDRLGRLDQREWWEALAELRAALQASARWASAAQSAEAVLLGTMTKLVPDHGRPTTHVRIEGTGFGSAGPAGVEVAFTSNTGSTVAAVPTSWSDTLIKVDVPNGVGVGPIGFRVNSSAMTALGGQPAGRLAGAIIGVLGATGGPLAAKLGGWMPVPGPELRPVASPGSANHFTGGPVLKSLSSLAAAPGAQIKAFGVEFASGDQIAVEGSAAVTTFVSSGELGFGVPAQASGRCAVGVQSPFESNPLSLQILPTLASLDRAQAKVGHRVGVVGSGFAAGATVLLDQLPVPTTRQGPDRLEFEVRRPPAPKTVTGGDTVAVTVVNPDGATTTALPLTILEQTTWVFGDSIAWGQGLTTGQKWTSLVADKLQAKAGTSERIGQPVTFAVSGAPINPPATGATGPFADPEVPSDLPSIQQQIATAKVRPDCPTVDLILLSAGINSVNVRTILNPRTREREILDLVDVHLRVGVEALLRSILDGFRNPTVAGGFKNARVVVTGYFPPVSEETDLDSIIALCGGFGFVAGSVVGPIGAAGTGGAVPPTGGAFGTGVGLVFAESARRTMAANSATFAAAADTALAAAVQGANTWAGATRCAFAPVGFGPSNAIRASDPWLFGFGLDPIIGIVPEDPMSTSRGASCSAISPAPFNCTWASVGHPNAAGAMVYANEAFKAFLTL